MNAQVAPLNESTLASEAFLATLNQLKERAEASAQAAEEASSKANSESGFAYNAKQNAEDHAKAISKVRGTVDADFSWLTTTKKNSDDLAQAIAATKSAADIDFRTIAESKATTEKELALIKTASEKIKAALLEVNRNQADAASASADVTARGAAISAAKTAAETGVNAIQALQTQAAEAAGKAVGDIATISKAEADSKTLLASMKETLATATESHERVINYQDELNGLKKSFSELHDKIEGLLPNATSAGLASSFRNQKGRFAKPQRNWLIAFVSAIVGLLAVSFIGLPSGTESWDVILRHLVNRLPLVAPLVWFALYAGRHYNLALRVEEEYAFKEAVSAAFEGYKREMADIPGGEDGSVKPLVTLCENVLRSIAQRPGRIYEGRHEDITPLTPVVNALGQAAAGVANAAVKK